MNFEFSDEANLLREQAQSFLADKCPPSAVRKILDGDEPYDRALWKQIADLGWTATTIPEAHGGLGLTHLELCVIAEELGRAVAPVPFSSSVYLAAEAIMLAGSTAQQEAWLPKLAAGEAIGTLAFAEGPGRPRPVDLSTRGNGASVTGRKVAVPDGDVADVAVVVAGEPTGDGATLYLVDLSAGGISREPVRTLDFSRSHANIDFNDAGAEVLGAVGEGWSTLNRLLDRAAILFAWEQVGGADAALNQAREYALGRYAFGRQIASYQAIKHKLVDMYVKIQLARSNCYYGAWALSTDAPELPLAAATARVAGIQAYHTASKENIQVHGGMGFTWEFDCQFHYRRSRLLAVNIGSEGFWQDRLIDAVQIQKQAAA